MALNNTIPLVFKIEIEFEGLKLRYYILMPCNCFTFPDHPLYDFHQVYSSATFSNPA